ncbi:MAG: hypothetical protein A3K68_00165 [Euryarchaeota archaeon RBG_16_68_13]|nr:MAG: hypothetical protein A3K68_00165 [Euryarchaeota archaeon RBG_16_68_13]
MEKAMRPATPSGGVSVPVAPPPRPAKRRRREGALILGVAVLLVPASLVVTSLTGGALGIVVYAGLLILLTVWNAWAVLDLARAVWFARAHRRALGVHVGLLAGALAAALLWGAGLDLSTKPRAPLFVAAALSLAYTVLQLFLSARRSRRDLLAPFYNLFNVVFLAVYLAAEQPATAVGNLPLAFARSVALFQFLNIHFVAAFGPFLLLPSFLPKLKGLKWPPGAPEGPGFGELLGRRRPTVRRWLHPPARIVSTAAGGFVVYAAVALLVFLPFGYATVASFNGIDPAALPYGVQPGTEFAATAGSLTDIVRPPANWPALVERERALAAELDLDFLRFDLKTEFLRDPTSLAALDRAVADIRSDGRDVILSPFGADSWSSSRPTFEDLNRTIADDAVFLADRYHPAYLFPFFEPNGQVAINLGHGMPTASWVGAVESVAPRVKAASPATRILIEVASGTQGLELAAALFASPAPIDAVGFDLYPQSASDLDQVDAYAEIARAHPAREFWISEFGLDAIQFGADAQARFLAAVLSRGSTRWNVAGFSVWALEDNAGLGMDKVLQSALGLTTLEGQRRPAFAVYRDAIAAIRP